MNATNSGYRGGWAPLPCPQDLFKMMQFLGSFKRKPILSKFWAQGPPWGQNPPDQNLGSAPGNTENHQTPKGRTWWSSPKFWVYFSLEDLQDRDGTTCGQNKKQSFLSVEILVVLMLFLFNVWIKDASHDYMITVFFLFFFEKGIWNISHGKKKVLPYVFFSSGCFPLNLFPAPARTEFRSVLGFRAKRRIKIHSLCSEQ